MLGGTIASAFNKKFGVAITSTKNVGAQHALLVRELVRELVRLFNRPEVNIGGAQLIFTRHDTSLLDAPGLFRRDQVWFVEQDHDQASAMISLSEFSPRKNEALERGYLMGRYGAVPLLDRSSGLKHGWRSTTPRRRV